MPVSGSVGDTGSLSDGYVLENILGSTLIPKWPLFHDGNSVSQAGLGPLGGGLRQSHAARISAARTLCMLGLRLLFSSTL